MERKDGDGALGCEHESEERIPSYQPFYLKIGGTKTCHWELFQALSEYYLLALSLLEDPDTRLGASTEPRGSLRHRISDICELLDVEALGIGHIRLVVVEGGLPQNSTITLHQPPSRACRRVFPYNTRHVASINLR